ncbi:MAG: HlyD family efflux transporter periplasmic adaptor subunit [Hungatella sp.]|nr:HlyD family efflux transporter periplasmic adaptor subunit [Hungatella sp.]
MDICAGKGSKMEEKNKTQDARNIKGMDEDQFQAELAELMKEEPGGKKKKGKKARRQRKPWSKKRKVITAAALILIVAAGFKVLGGEKEKTVMVSTSALIKGTIQEELTISGPVSGTDSVDVVSNLHAEVVDIKVKEGDHVEAGQLLAVIDDSDVRKEMDMAQNAYDLAVSTYNEQQILAENGYARALQEQEAARKDFDRTNVLYQSGSVSQLEWETARDKLREAQRQVRTFTVVDGRAVANESYSLQVKNAEFELEKKKEQLEDTQVTSPIAGTVVRVNTKIGRFADKIEDDKPMFIIENLDMLEMKVSVSEYSIGNIQVGQEAVISADILNGETVAGKVTAISPTGEEKGNGSTERVIPTTIQIIEDNTKLIAGITARARIILNEADDAWIVPISSVLETADGSFVLTVDQGVIRWIPVEKGVESDIQIQVIPVEEGSLTEGMGIVAAPNEGLYEGMKVLENGTGR